MSIGINGLPSIMHRKEEFLHRPVALGQCGDVGKTYYKGYVTG
jgi:hypothetical protein